MKKCIVVLTILGSAAVALASASNEAVTLPEIRAVDSWYHPAVVVQVAPEYPYELRRAGVEGRVSLDLVVDNRGRVKRITVLDSDNFALSDAARGAIEHWKFIPADPKAKIENRHARVTFNFVLEPSVSIAAAVRRNDAS